MALNRFQSVNSRQMPRRLLSGCGVRYQLAPNSSASPQSPFPRTSIADAAAVGIVPVSKLWFSKAGEGTAKVWDTLSTRTADYRSSRKRKMGFETKARKRADELAKVEG